MGGVGGTLVLALVATLGRVVVPIAVQQTLDRGLGAVGGPDVGFMTSMALAAAAYNTGEVRVVTLAYPGEEDSRQGKISVITPVGSALIACAGSAYQIAAGGTLARADQGIERNMAGAATHDARGGPPVVEDVPGRDVNGHGPLPRPCPADGIDPGKLSGLAVLAEQMDLVPEAHHRLREARVVDVAAGSAQQVAVEYEDLDAR